MLLVMGMSIIRNNLISYEFRSSSENHTPLEVEMASSKPKTQKLIIV